MAFSKGHTPYPKWCAIFSLLSGVIMIILMKFVRNAAIANAISIDWISIFERRSLICIPRFTKHGELGVSPISSVANVLSCKFSAFSLGTWLIIWNCILIVGQIVVLRKKFQLIQLLQVPLSFLFGWFTDFGMWIAAKIPVPTYFTRMTMVLIGIIILGFGISLSVTANVILNSGEAFVKAISDTTNKEFGNVKIAFDVTCVILAVLLSFIFFNFTIVGTREGTIISA